MSRRRPGGDAPPGGSGVQREEEQSERVNFNIGSSVFYQQALVRQFDIFGIPEDLRPEIRGMNDPYDYLRPGLATFNDKAKTGREHPSGKANPTCRF